jgi:Arc/MetJ family transcription regulator
MRTTLNLDDDLLARASQLTGIEEKTLLLHMGLEALIQRESSRRLAALGGSKPDFSVAPRRRITESLTLAEKPVKYGTRRHKPVD